jgi:hypothetical protein
MEIALYQLMLRRRHNDVLSANRFQISVEYQNPSAEDRGDIFEELAPKGLVGCKEFSLRARLPNAWQVRRPVDFNRPVGLGPNECCTVTEG